MSAENYREESDIHTGKLRLPDDYAIPEQHHHAETFTSIRTAQHLGKEVRVETTYRMTIDGKPVTSHIGVNDDGSVHTHGLPNYSFASALELGKRLVSATNVELPKDELGSKDGGHH